MSLGDILRDCVSGSSTLYKKTIDLFLGNPYYHHPPRTVYAVERLIEQFPEMAVFVYLKSRLAKSSGKTIALLLQDLQSEADAELGMIGRNLDRIWKSPKRIVTYSRSSVATRLILERCHKIRSLLISTGAPHNEGALSAEVFADCGIRVVLCSDAALPGMIERDDLLILGADGVTEHYFVNKCGSLSLALAAREAKAVSCVVYERFKRVDSRRFSFRPKQHPTREIVARGKHHIDICNAYFEKVPADLVNWFITSGGMIRGKDMARAGMAARA
jgi:translation initiation factor 2B subunit (eIF-2B alpha/beta/delta family)